MGTVLHSAVVVSLLWTEFTISLCFLFFSQFFIPFQSNILFTGNYTKPWHICWTLDSCAVPTRIRCKQTHTFSQCVLLLSSFLLTMVFLDKEVNCFQCFHPILWVALIFALILFRFKWPNHKKQRIQGTRLEDVEKLQAKFSSLISAVVFQSHIHDWIQCRYSHRWGYESILFPWCRADISWCSDKLNWSVSIYPLLAWPDPPLHSSRVHWLFVS